MQKSIKLYTIFCKSNNNTSYSFINVFKDQKMRQLLSWTCPRRGPKLSHLADAIVLKIGEHLKSFSSLHIPLIGFQCKWLAHFPFNWRHGLCSDRGATYNTISWGIDTTRLARLCIFKAEVAMNDEGGYLLLPEFLPINHRQSILLIDCIPIDKEEPSLLYIESNRLLTFHHRRNNIFAFG